MDRLPRNVALVLSLGLAVATGCNSPYHADRGALFGGLAGAGVGAVVGSAVGAPGAGAAIGAGAGALTGAAVGAGMDEVEAHNREMIAAHMGRPVPAGAVTLDQVVAMSRSGVNEDLIITHVQRNGMAAPLSANDIIILKQQGVSDRLVATLQAQPMVAPQAIAAQPVGVPVQPVVMAPPPVVYYDPWYPRPYWRPAPVYHRHPGVSWGVSVSN